MAASLKYNAEWYLPNNTLSRTIPDKQIRAEYTRLRDIAQKRIKRLGESEWISSETYQRYKGGFPKLSQIPNRTNLSYELAKLSRFVSAKTTTVTGLRHQRTEQLKSLKKHGYDFVNKENIDKFGQFMEDFRNKELGRRKEGSPIVVELFYQTERLGLDPKVVARDFDYWLSNLETMAQIQPIKGKTAGSSTAIRKKIARRKRGRT